MPELPFEGPESLLLSNLLLAEARKFLDGTEVETFLQSVAQFSAFYPDGSMEILLDELDHACRTALEEFRIKLLEAFNAKRTTEQRPTGLEGFQTNFRGIWGSPRRLYNLWYSDSAQTYLGDQSFLVIPDAWSPVAPNEAEPASFNIAILLRSKPSQNDRNSAARIIASWFDCATSGGAMGEGPTRLCEPHLEWHNRVALLRADFSRSGQQTLNWLTLWLIDHGSQLALEAVCFGDLESPLLQPSIRSHGFVQTLPRNTHEDSSPGPQGTGPKRIRVTREAGSTMDMILLAVRFGEAVEDSAQRDHLGMIVGAWSHLGLLGGYGGRFAYLGPIEWDSAHEELRLRIDFGDAAELESIEVLTRVLSTVSKEIVPVEEISLRRS